MNFLTAKVLVLDFQWLLDSQLDDKKFYQVYLMQLMEMASVLALSWALKMASTLAPAMALRTVRVMATMLALTLDFQWMDFQWLLGSRLDDEKDDQI